MSKNTPFANEEVMEDYLSSLLSDTVDPVEVTERTAKLLEQATVDLTETESEQDSALEQAVVSAEEEIVSQVNDSVDEAAKTPPGGVPLKPLEERLDNHFQALFFEVAGLTLAVPLITLGGIHNLGKIGPLFGKPGWFMGVMIHRDEKFNVVNTAQWVMPEKYDQSLEDKLHYQYLIMLSDSEWGLASEKLVNTVSLSKEDVKWRQVSAKRPWLAGMVKDKMCALLDVDELIAMLNNGLGSKDQVP
ncbi:chemotaxis protein CheW [Alteromonas gilva]|uniref:Chemotaxis protein CheW n=1 Tax=Alteromonas gilva TaxID=2987522 RepID=A0ABT5L408_9ALTE|nr:chemotaxis protein CheW [Alteromonas gilva]MDC8830513.1 chemotaxis protein CheW [Alteromonas gilva]